MYIGIATKKLPTKELRRRIKTLKPKGKYASRATWGSIIEYEQEIRRRKKRR